MDPRWKRVGKNEALFREVNDQTSNLADSANVEFLCECGNSECLAAIELTLADYEAVRADPTLFLIVPGHEAPDVEVVVERHSHYVLIQKREGEPAQLAIESDPRQ